MNKILKCYLVSKRVEDINKIVNVFNSVVKKDLSVLTVFSTYADFILKLYKEDEKHAYGFMKRFYREDELKFIDVAAIYILENEVDKPIGNLSAEVSKDFKVIDVRPRDEIIEKYKLYLYGWKSMLDVHLFKVDFVIRELIFKLEELRDRIIYEEEDSCFPFTKFSVI